MAKGIGGRPTVYTPKDGKATVRVISGDGEKVMERVRKQLQKLTGWTSRIGDGDVFDYVLRVFAHGKEKADKEIQK